MKPPRRPPRRKSRMPRCPAPEPPSVPLRVGAKSGGQWAGAGGSARQQRSEAVERRSTLSINFVTSRCRTRVEILGHGMRRSGDSHWLSSRCGHPGRVAAASAQLRQCANSPEGARSVASSSNAGRAARRGPLCGDGGGEPRTGSWPTAVGAQRRLRDASATRVRGAASMLCRTPSSRERRSRSASKTMTIVCSRSAACLMPSRRARSPSFIGALRSVSAPRPCRARPRPPAGRTPACSSYLGGAFGRFARHRTRPATGDANTRAATRRARRDHVMSDCPVISGGCAKPMSCNRLGARSARMAVAQARAGGAADKDDRHGVERVRGLRPARHRVDHGLRNCPWSAVTNHCAPRPFQRPADARPSPVFHPLRRP